MSFKFRGVILKFWEASEHAQILKTLFIANLKSKSSFGPQRVLSGLGETSDTMIDENLIILEILRLDAYLGIIVLWLHLWKNQFKDTHSITYSYSPS